MQILKKKNLMQREVPCPRSQLHEELNFKPRILTPELMFLPTIFKLLRNVTYYFYFMKTGKGRKVKRKEEKKSREAVII